MLKLCGRVPIPHVWSGMLVMLLFAYIEREHLLEDGRGVGLGLRALGCHSAQGRRKRGERVTKMMMRAGRRDAYVQ